MLGRRYPAGLLPSHVPLPACLPFCSLGLCFSRTSMLSFSRVSQHPLSLPQPTFFPFVASLLLCPLQLDIVAALLKQQETSITPSFLAPFCSLLSLKLAPLGKMGVGWGENLVVEQRKGGGASSPSPLAQCYSNCDSGPT